MTFNCCNRCSKSECDSTASCFEIVLEECCQVCLVGFGCIISCFPIHLSSTSKKLVTCLILHIDESILHKSRLAISVIANLIRLVIDRPQFDFLQAREPRHPLHHCRWHKNTCIWMEVNLYQKLPDGRYNFSFSCNKQTVDERFQHIKCSTFDVHLHDINIRMTIFPYQVLY